MYIFFIVASGQEKSQRLLNEACRVNLVSFLSVLDETCQQLVTGKISLQLLYLVLKHQENFLKLVQYASVFKDESFAKQVLDTRRQEVDHFRAVKKDVVALFDFCKNLGCGKRLKS